MMVFWLQIAAVAGMLSMANVWASPDSVDASRVEVLEKELARNEALLKSLSAHIELQKQEREELYRQQYRSGNPVNPSDSETLLYTNGEPDPAMMSDVVYEPHQDIPVSQANMVQPESKNKGGGKNQPQSSALKKAMSKIARKEFSAAYRALVDLSQKSQEEDYPLVVYWLGMLDLYQNKKPDLAARWFSKAYPFWEKSETNQDKIFSAYLLLHLTQALMKQNKKEDALVVFAQCEQCLKKIKDKPKKLTLAVEDLHDMLSRRSAAQPAPKRMSHSAISTPQDVNSMDDEDEQYSETGAA
jgi:hypothetical protein